MRAPPAGSINQIGCRSVVSAANREEKLMNVVTRRSWLAIAAMLFGCLTLQSSFAQGAGDAPDALVKRVVEDVMTTVKSDKDIQAGNISRINDLVESKILPYVDFKKMTASAVGRNWSTATPAQQDQITEQFRKLLVYTYAGALGQVRDQTIQYKPFRADPADTTVTVQTQVINTRGGDPIQLNYRLTKEADGWKIIDVNVLGVWLVENYRNTFAQQVSAGGIDGLIKALTDKNAQLAAQKGKV
jgi:phospholipid transport system substrate-binding protein